MKSGSVIELLRAFREATPAIYLELLAIRFAIVAPQGFLLWVCFEGFHLHIPLVQVAATSPVILAAGGAPVAPAGLGPLQAVAVNVFSGFAPRAQVMAASLAFSVSHLVLPLPLGIGSAGVFISTVLRAGGRPGEESGQEKASGSVKSPRVRQPIDYAGE
jgi:uncharacterized membrane protein YbhN (UPF0104 family)